ncbi:phage portal protein [Hathewaya histolytica]|uniref:phage portal protein n=1 Tax=Hathewaya histolytica TaxID=1498 RepID=UPI003B681778
MFQRLKSAWDVLTHKNDTFESSVVRKILEFNHSGKRKLMIAGENYYDVDNDILNRQITRYTENGAMEDRSKSNNKLAHGFMKNIVDEKVGYLLSRPFSFSSEDKTYIDKVEKLLGKKLKYRMYNQGIESANKGIGWWQIYINDKGEFGYIKIPSEQCIPIWEDNSHEELKAMIRYYIVTEWSGERKKEITKVEYYTPEGVEYFRLDNKNLIPEDREQGPLPHYKKGEESKVWGKVPFIAFKNNSRELPDIKFVKSLIDDYDLRRSDISNIIEECKNFIYVLKNYGGEDLGEFIADLNYYRAVKTDTDGGVDTLTPKIDNQAAKEHFEELKRDIKLFSSSVNMDLDKFGSAPSGVSLKFLYSGLDLKCNNMEMEFKNAWDQLKYFIDMYLLETEQGNYTNSEIDIIFNRDIIINETDSIDNCSKSKGVISDETIIENHPWVKDPQLEKQRLEEESKKTIDFDLIPGGEGDGQESEVLGEKAGEVN